jgi:hypothetical protein
VRLDSVRELKAEIADVVTHQLSSLQAVAAFGIPARRASDVARRPATVAYGIAPGSRPRGFRLAMRVQHRGLEDSPQVEELTRKAKGEVDIRYVGRISKRAAPWQQQRHRPLVPGISVGHFEVTAGTLGCFVEGRRGRPRILSNNHVLADENRAAIGDPILQPGRFDSGRRPRDTVASLDRMVRLTSGRPNKVDCALATVLTDVEVDAADFRGIGPLKGVADSLPDDDAVEKLGRTTGHTAGRITAFELDNVVVAYDTGTLTFDDQLEIEGTGTRPFSQGGDSGSLILTSGDHFALALLFAGGDQGGSNGKGLTYANPIGAVLGALRATLMVD